MECIVHFTVFYPEGSKKLRGLVFVDEGKLPEKEQIIEMFHEMEYKVVPDPDEELLYKPADAGEKYKYIRVNELDVGQEKYTEDRNLKSIIGNLLPKRPGL